MNKDINPISFEFLKPFNVVHDQSINYVRLHGANLLGDDQTILEKIKIFIMEKEDDLSSIMSTVSQSQRNYLIIIGRLNPSITAIKKFSIVYKIRKIDLLRTIKHIYSVTMTGKVRKMTPYKTKKHFLALAGIGPKKAETLKQYFNSVPELLYHRQNHTTKYQRLCQEQDAICKHIDKIFD